MDADLAPALMTVDQFLDWADGREGKFELDEGRVVLMAPERVVHGRLKSAIFRSLEDAVATSAKNCEAFVDSIAVRVDPHTSYVPDVLVHCGDRLDGDERETRGAVVVVEVLSPSTAYRDASAKLSGYFRVPSVRHYLIVDGGRRIVIHHRRDRDDLIATRILSNGGLTLDPPGLSVDVADWLPREAD